MHRKPTTHYFEHSLCFQGQCNVAEQMYGTTLKLPGEMFPATESKIYEAELVRKLKSTMRHLKPVQDQYSTMQTFRKYHLFSVLHGKEKYFKIDKNGKEDNVLIDRLKPAYISQESQIYEEHSYSQPSIGF
ncbi:hypothetical protein GWI33_020517 [Rhynchophorus ferrugineus]|uniref:Uncharacterized protein n=1 Tax=Rhynchophorus ferrugineus TaxID=354439 RepID=A0A834HPC6_RHYFE|nr:hypothetical protein GWI33_020517 [Rhynchophorus ferrugineus]